MPGFSKYQRGFTYPPCEKEHGMCRGKPDSVLLGRMRNLESKRAERGKGRRVEENFSDLTRQCGILALMRR